MLLFPHRLKEKVMFPSHVNSPHSIPTSSGTQRSLVKLKSTEKLEPPFPLRHFSVVFERRHSSLQPDLQPSIRGGHILWLSNKRELSYNIELLAINAGCVLTFAREDAIANLSYDTTKVVLDESFGFSSLKHYHMQWI